MLAKVETFFTHEDFLIQKKRREFNLIFDIDSGELIC